MKKKMLNKSGMKIDKKIDKPEMKKTSKKGKEDDSQMIKDFVKGKG